MQIIETQHLTKAFGNVTAIDNLTFSVEEGEIFGLVGPDGAGKTTLTRMLTGILSPSAGEAWVAGYNIAKDAEAIKEKIGYMSQKFGLYEDLTVLENIAFFADIYGVRGKNRKDKIEELLHFSQLQEFHDRLAGNLSGGMKQKLALSCALIHTPKILFLDEPTNGVDPVSRRDFWRILYHLHREEVTIFLTTAYLEEAERCGHVAFAHKGKFLIEGTPKEVKQHLIGKVLEISCAKPRRAMLALQNTLGNDCVKLFGNRIHVYLYTEQPKILVAKVEQILDSNEIREHHIILAEPTLEDVFMSLMRESEEEAADAVH
ncbi:MAG: ABC transporter ATP-binding protein [Chlamydiia bacterium]|nr:ABC transporter ATP-binding protein [Chlamydiia bacterium]